ncbi:hypothetical protein BIV57_06125 [Mangrovactinospora gilvigrisea]|uniref:Sugar ABC transporter substrate-binding protein n=1 Tax=Mangrovactinospora gilvigrisea TaxID=1428644 RepID=A0A1J7BI68_9ACTN|nr:extracellular solute-binding protein [Mangrovactinospora gilvigrisea]OIV38367.1 hypothetical protein BIV57_06125 [Mangrovactinospora gilvigrisea]
MSRRTLLRSAGIATAAALSPALLTACGSGSKGGGNVANKGTKLTPWPTFTPKTGPAPDLKGDVTTGVEDAYLKYPSKLTKGTSGTPGDGSTLKVMTITYGTPPTARAKNQYWQAMEKALGVKIDFTAIPAADFQSKMSTVMAGNDLPDILNIGGGNTLAHEADFVMKTMANLSEYVSGDAIKDYPNLANIPTNAWSSVGRFHGGIYGVPIQRAKPASVMWINRDSFDKAGYKPTGSWTQEEYSAAVKELTKGKQYGIGSLPQGVWASSYGIANGWSMKGGMFTSQYEDPHWKDLLSYTNGLWKQKQIWPNSPTGSTVDFKTQYYNGTIQSYTDGFSALPTTLSVIHDFLPAPMLPFTVNGIAGAAYAGSNIFGYTTLNKNLSKAKIKMVLKVLDWLASPFGTEEYQLLMYGVEGVHFKYNGAGDPIPTKLGTTENVINLPFWYMCSAPQVLYVPGAQAGIKAAYEWEQQTSSKMIVNPTLGLRSDTQTSVGATISQNMTDTITGIITGRQPVSSWDAAVKKWKSGGGDKIASEYASEFAANTTK